MNVLFIDTSSNKEITVSLTIEEKEYTKKKTIGIQKAQIVLPLIDQLLTEYTLKLSDITSINVHTGPGSFTGIRVGVSIANALGFALGIPINGKKVGEFVFPIYE